MPDRPRPRSKLPLAAFLLLSALPAAASSQPAYGAQIQLHHVADGDDRCDIQMNNLTGMQIVWKNPESNNSEVDAWAVNLSGFAPSGWENTLDSGTPSSLTTIRWLHTIEGDAYWAQDYDIWCGFNCPNTYNNSGWYNFHLVTYPQSHTSLASVLGLAFSIMDSIVNITEIVCGDEEAWYNLVANVADAVEEGNEIANAPNYGWAGICYPDNDLDTPVKDLAYPLEPGSDNKQDHVAFDINGQFVAEVTTVNQASSITGNTQYLVNFYTRSQWDTANYSTKNPLPPPVRASSLPK